jgi:trans-aconitate methyltransferase
VIADLETLEELPAADLVLSCATLPFVRREAFAPLWALIRASLQPGGVLAADLFGERDDWAGSEGTYLARTEVDALLEGLEVVELAEEERDGRSFAGPKHWHTFQVIARRPG